MQQRQALADALARYLSQLGLERRHKVKSLTELLTADHSDDDDGNGTQKNDQDSVDEQSQPTAPIINIIIGQE